MNIIANFFISMIIIIFIIILSMFISWNTFMKPMNTCVCTNGESFQLYEGKIM